MRLFLWLPGYAGGGVTGVADGADVAGWGCCWGCVGAAVTWGWDDGAGGAGRSGVTCCFAVMAGGVAGVAWAVTWPWADKNWRQRYLRCPSSRAPPDPAPPGGLSPAQLQPPPQRERHCPGPGVAT